MFSWISNRVNRIIEGICANDYLSSLGHEAEKDYSITLEGYF